MGRKYGIKGMVRNVSDGSVEIFAQGNEQQIKGFEKEIEISVSSGPQVFKVERHVEGSAGFRSFGHYDRFVKEKSV